MHNFKIWYVILHAKHLVYSEPCGNFLLTIRQPQDLLNKPG